MRLYLVQHGDALPEKLDPSRRLSERGKSDICNLAEFCARAGVTVSLVIHSGKNRAEQTAQLLADSIAPGCDTEVSGDIGPLDTVGKFKKRIPDLAGDTLVVGHLPYMAKLVTSLLCGREEPPGVSFSPGTIVCLEQREDGGWAIAWMLRPELLRGCT